MLKQRFPRTEIVKGNLAVTVKFSDYEVQLLPALRESGKVQIAGRDGTTWTKPINIAAFTRRLTETNRSNGNKVVPVIKIVKSLFDHLPPKYQLSGYYVEALAVDAFSVYNGRYTLYDMTKHLLDHSVKVALNFARSIVAKSPRMGFVSQDHSYTKIPAESDSKPSDQKENRSEETDTSKDIK